MEKIKLLHRHWGYPVCDNPEALQKNIDVIFQNIPRKIVQFTGIGTSGAMLLAALSARMPNAAEFIGAKAPFVLLRKPADDTAQGRRYIEFNKWPIIVVDDHICDGGTMKKIAKELKALDVIDQVVGVIAMSYNVDYSDHYFNKHTALLPEIFPSIKFWIH